VCDLRADFITSCLVSGASVRRQADSWTSSSSSSPFSSARQPMPPS
jgi:hypothetical protein